VATNAKGDMTMVTGRMDAKCIACGHKWVVYWEVDICPKCDRCYDSEGNKVVYLKVGENWTNFQITEEAANDED